MRSIRIRLVLLLIIPLSILACLVAFETFFTARKISNDLHDQTLLAVMLAISENVVASDGDVLAETTLEVLTSNLGDQFFYHLAGPQNGFITGYTGVPPIPEDLQLVSGVPIFYDAFYQGDPVRVSALRQFSSAEFLNGWVTITTWRKVTQRDNVTLNLFGRSLARLVLLILSAGIIVWFAVAIGLKPINNLRRAIEKRSSSDLSPIKRQLPTELTGIAGAMNDLLERVARSKANREQFIGNAAHQLRNPIAAIKLQAQTAIAKDTTRELKAGLSRVLETTNETGALIEHMLSSAGANSLSMDKAEPLLLTELVADIARFLAPQAIEKKQDFSFIETDETIMVSAHRILLKEAITNLIENAIRHNDQSAIIQVSVKVDEALKSANVDVFDNGAFISEEALNTLSQPFATGENKSSSSGLGLSITKDVAKAHGGDLYVYAEAHGGKTISISLPYSP